MTALLLLLLLMKKSSSIHQLYYAQMPSIDLNMSYCLNENEEYLMTDNQMMSSEFVFNNLKEKTNKVEDCFVLVYTGKYRTSRRHIFVCFQRLGNLLMGI